MKYRTILIATFAALFISASAHDGEKLIYDDSLNPVEQINAAIAKARKEGKFVVCQLGGNWCPWCLRFAKFITSDPEINQVVDDNFVYIHVAYNPHSAEDDPVRRAATAEMLRMTGNPVRFGFPVLVVLNADGRVTHIQDSALLEKGIGYNRDNVLRFFKNWTPSAVNSEQ